MILAILILSGMTLFLVIDAIIENRRIAKDYDVLKLTSAWRRELIKTLEDLDDRILSLEEKLKDRKSTRLNSSHIPLSRMPSSA